MQWNALMVIRINIESKQICAIKIIHLDQAPEDPEDVQKVFMWFVSMHSMAYTTCRNQIFSRLLIPSISPNTMIQSSRYIHHTIIISTIYLFTHWKFRVNSIYKLSLIIMNAYIWITINASKIIYNFNIKVKYLFIIIIEILLQDDTLYLVMEYIAPGSLKDYVCYYLKR